VRSCCPEKTGARGCEAITFHIAGDQGERPPADAQVGMQPLPSRAIHAQAARYMRPPYDSHADVRLSAELAYYSCAPDDVRANKVAASVGASRRLA
jgi:hypothetical protein